MKRFIRRHADEISGVLSGFDRLRFRGTLLCLAHPQGMRSYLNSNNILLKDFKSYVEGATQLIVDHTKRLVKEFDRPYRFLASYRDSKEAIAAKIVERDKIEVGLICVLNAVESCYSYEVRRVAETRRLELIGRQQKCGHYYFYVQHPLFGFMHLRLQTWFPFTIHICINGREWLARQMASVGIRYQRADNCFLAIADFQKAQELANQQLRTNWSKVFKTLLRVYHPAYFELFPRYPQEYYWTVDESEWATDVVFRDQVALSRLYPSLLRHAGYHLDSTDVLKFLGRKLTAKGKLFGRFTGDVVTDIAQRADHVRVKHRINKNWLKMYDKQQRVLRVETTINDIKDMKAYRRVHGDPQSKPDWRSLRKSVADLSRRAQISQASNARYLDAMAEVTATQPLGESLRALCKPAEIGGKRVRALQPWAPHDSKLLESIGREGFMVHGFRNRDLRTLLFGTNEVSDQERKRQSAKVSRQLRMLRAHGLIHKVLKSHRYQLTNRGRTIIAALRAAHQATPEQLAKLAAA